jgi:hypothetical protein
VDEVSVFQLQINPFVRDQLFFLAIHTASWDFFLAPQADRDGGKVEIPTLDFPFSTVPV